MSNNSGPVPKEKPTKFSSVSQDISGVRHSKSVKSGKTVYDPEMYERLKNMPSAPSDLPPTVQIDVTEETPLPDFEPYESKLKTDDPPTGYIPLDVLAYEERNFLRSIRTDLRQQTSIWFDEPCPVWFQRVDVFGAIKRFKPHQEIMITGLEFISWFWPEYQLFRQSAPEGFDPTEWGRMKSHILTSCFRDFSQQPSVDKDGKPKFSKEGGEIETAHTQFERWGIIPMAWIGARIEYELSAKPRVSLVHAVERIMLERRIAFKKSYSPTEVDIVAESLAADSGLYGIESEVSSHLSGEPEHKNAADFIIVPLMLKVAEKNLPGANK